MDMRTWGLGPRWRRLTCRILRKQHMELEATAPGGSDQRPSAALLIPIQYRGGTATFPGAGGTDRLGTPCVFLWRADWPSFLPFDSAGMGALHPGRQRDRATPKPTCEGSFAEKPGTCKLVFPWASGVSAHTVSSAPPKETKSDQKVPLPFSVLIYVFHSPSHIFKKMHDHTFLN